MDIKINNKDEILWVHGVRAIAIFSVIFLHASALLLIESEFASYSWWVGNIYNSFVRMAVPIFFMISGFLILSKDEATYVFYKKRVSKVLAPFIVWTIFYSVWLHLYRAGLPYAEYDWSSVSRHLWQPSYYHMWFLYILFAFYLAMPVFKRIIDVQNRSLVKKIVFAWFILFYILPIPYYFAADSFLSTDQQAKIAADLFILSKFVNFFGYLYLGYLLGTMKITRNHFIASCWIVLLGYLVIVFGCYYATLRDGGVLNEYFYGNSPGIVIYAIASFIVMRYLLEMKAVNFNDKYKSTIILLGTVSFGVYLLHPLIMDILNSDMLGFRLSATGAAPLASTIVYTSVTIVVCVIGVYWVRKVPVVGRLLA